MGNNYIFLVFPEKEKKILDALTLDLFDNIKWEFIDRKRNFLHVNAIF